jgi:hypothetical protein
MSLIRTILTKVFPDNTIVHKWADTLEDEQKEVSGTVSSLYGGNSLGDTAKGIVYAGNDALDAYTYNLLSAVNKTSAGISAGAKSTVVSSDIGTFIQKNFLWIVAVIALLLIFKPFKR